MLLLVFLFSSSRISTESNSSELFCCCMSFTNMGVCHVRLYDRMQWASEQEIDHVRTHRTSSHWTTFIWSYVSLPYACVVALAFLFNFFFLHRRRCRLVVPFSSSYTLRAYSNTYLFTIAARIHQYDDVLPFFQCFFSYSIPFQSCLVYSFHIYTQPFEFVPVFLFVRCNIHTCDRVCISLSLFHCCCCRVAMCYVRCWSDQRVSWGIQSARNMRSIDNVWINWFELITLHIILAVVYCFCLLTFTGFYCQYFFKEENR